MGKNARFREMVAEIVESSQIFHKAFSADYRQMLIQSMKVIHFPANSYIIRQKSTGKMFYVIVEGVCKVTDTDKTTLVESEIMKFSVGDHFGLEALTDPGHERPYNVLAAHGS